MIEVKEIGYGTMCRIDNTVYVNRKLKAHPDLHRAILSHELKHSGNLTLKDIKLDLRNSDLDNYRWEYYKFILKTPSAWILFCPVWKYDNHLAVDVNLLFLYLLFGVVYTFVRLLLV